ncbi:MAG: hypothetical protein HZA32_20970 [Opitutae bacterium]|nr:hypothetical protein [Opitutae bacterium]
MAFASVGQQRHYLSVNTRLTALDAEGVTLSDWRVIALSGTAYVDSIVAREIFWCPGLEWEPWVFTDGWVKLLPSTSVTLANLGANGERTWWYQVIERNADGSIARDDLFYDPDYENPPSPPNEPPPDEPPFGPPESER